MVHKPDDTRLRGNGLPIYLLVGMTKVLLWKTSNATLTAQP